MANTTDWVISSIKALREKGSWTGRVHVHKLLFTAEVLRLATPPFRFGLYHFGPYARDLDETFAELEAAGEILREYPKPGYGPKYSALGNASLEPQDQAAIDRVASEFRDRNSRDLELIATCLWAERREHLTEDDQIVQRVRDLKPRYEAHEIKKSLCDSREIAKNLTAN